MTINDILGNYVYRSLHNNQFIGEDFLKLRFGEGFMSITKLTGSKFEGYFDMGNNYLMNLDGEINDVENQLLVNMKGVGKENSPTQGWIYEYHGYLVPAWSNGIGQLKTIVGTVIRSADHGTAKAGYTATFYMVDRE